MMKRDQLTLRAVHRLFTFAFVPGDPVVFLLSMLVFVPIGKNIERQLGTVVFVATVLIFAALQGLLLFFYYAILVYGFAVHVCGVSLRADGAQPRV